MGPRPEPITGREPEKRLVEFLLARFEEAWEGSKWHSFKGAWEGLTEAEATWKASAYQSPKPWGFSGSIVDILYHVAVDSLVMPNQAFGDRTLTTEAVRERFQARGAHLAAALALLEEGYAATRNALAKLSDRDLPKQAGREQWPSRMRRVEGLFTELIEHYLYHAGQISYIRCLWAGATAEREEGAEI